MGAQKFVILFDVFKALDDCAPSHKRRPTDHKYLVSNGELLFFLDKGPHGKPDRAEIRAG